MRSLLTPPRREATELIDSTEWPERDFEESFADVARVNRYLGGTHAVLSTLRPMIRSLPPERREVTLLDLATGSGDIPRAIVDQARCRRFGDRQVRVVGVDNHPTVLALAQRQCASYPEISIERGDVFALPHPDKSFDFVLCSLAFHHFGPDGCVSVLREMDRIAVHGLIVNDLIRDRLACALIWLLTRLVGANRLTRHDAPLSVLRAYTVPEYVDLVRRAGITECTVHRLPFYRAVIARHPSTLG